MLQNFYFILYNKEYKDGISMKQVEVTVRVLEDIEKAAKMLFVA